MRTDGDCRPATQTIATSQPAPDAPRPRVLGLVNAPVDWGGTTWGAYRWVDVVSASPRRRQETLLHELFHGVESRLGLRRDALAFRQARRTLYQDGSERERAAEITEGLAGYTATVVAAQSAAEAIESALNRLGAAEAEESFVRTFAYTSGPAYGVLLDAASPGWPRRVRGTDDLGLLVMTALEVQPATDATASAVRYGGAALRASEQQREQQRQERVAELRRRFVDGPLLRVPGGGSASSDARGAVGMQGIGTVFFGPFRASGPWGTLEAEQGVLVETDGGARRLAAPVQRDEASASGEGWIFKAAPGWVIREGTRPGDFEVVRQ